MDRSKTQQGAADRVHQNFEPFYEWDSNERRITVLLPEYRRDQVRVQVTSKPTLKLMGERLVTGNKWHSFDLELPIPSDYDTDNIIAKFEGGKLSVKFGKLVKPREPTPPQPEVPRPSEQPQRVDQKKTAQEDALKAKQDKSEERATNEVSDQKTPQKVDQQKTAKEGVTEAKEDKAEEKAKNEVSDQKTPQKVDQQKTAKEDAPEAKEGAPEAKEVKAEEKTNNGVFDQKTPRKEPIDETEKSKIETPDTKDKVAQEAKTDDLTKTTEAATSKAPEPRVAKPVSRSKTRLIDFTLSFASSRDDKEAVRDSKAGVNKWKKWMKWMVLIILVVGLGFYARNAFRSSIGELNFQELGFIPEDYFLEL